MTTVSITVKDIAGNELMSLTEDTQAILVYDKEYNEGDSIEFSVGKINTFYCIRIDDTIDESFVYITKPCITYEIPFHIKRTSFNPKSFQGNRHYITIRLARDFEVSNYKNLAKNTMDQNADVGCYPHVHANVETRGEANFAAKNVINGMISNKKHGSWPYESWGINKQDDAEITLEFGRPIDMHELVLYTRADFPHDNWWVQATVTCSDGSTEIISMEKSYKPHIFTMKHSGISWIRLSNLIKADDPSPYPALTQLEVYGHEAKNAMKNGIR